MRLFDFLKKKGKEQEGLISVTNTSQTTEKKSAEGQSNPISQPQTMAEKPIQKEVRKGPDIVVENDNRKNQGYMETILRNWGYEAKEIVCRGGIRDTSTVIQEETLNLKWAEQKAKMLGAGVKEAMAYFLARNTIGYLYECRSYPKCPVRKDRANCGLVISEPDREGYYQWKPLEQILPVDFASIESKLGFSLHKDIKALVSSYFYFMLEAGIKDGSMHIYPFLPTTNVEDYVVGSFEKESYAGDYDFILNGHFFNLGGACIGGDDSFILEVNNETGEVLAVEYMDKRYIKIADSLYDLFMNSKPIYYNE